MATALNSKSYKYQWAREVARRTLEEDLAALKDRIEKVEDTDRLNLNGGESVAGLVEATKKLTGVGFIPPQPDKFKVGIVGAGVAGLFTAMVFDWLNENEELKALGLEIDYDILEAAGEERLGGRLYTHHFSDKEHDYYDVGAMRFPNNAVMKRTFQLFDFIGLKQGKGGLIPYHLADDNNVCPSYFNDVGLFGNVWKVKDVKDPYKINCGLPEDGKIPTNLLERDPSELVSEALDLFINSTKTKFEEYRDEVKKSGQAQNGTRNESGKGKEGGEAYPKATKLWKHLMKADNMSVRQFLASKDNGEDIPEGPDYNFNTIEWLETATFGTGWYDQALTECVLEELDFGTPKQEEGQPQRQYWWCVDGGAQRIAKLMAGKIKKDVRFNTKVTGIDANAGKRANIEDYVPMTVQVKDKEPEDYFAVFNSTTLSAFQRMNLQKAGLLWGTKQAIRALGYGASCKVAIKFSRPWWQLKPFKINKGGVSRTDLPLRVCVYPSYNTPEAEGDNWDENGSSVLLCSYTWGQDAQRLGSLISPDTPNNEEELKAVLLHNLALLHTKEEEDMPYEKLLALLNEEYVTHHAWDWYRDQNMSGAFAYFGPGQFSNMWEEVTKPNAFGQLYFVGEAASSHHAWIVGALESVIRAVYLMFEGLKRNNDFKAYSVAMKLLREGPTDLASSEGDKKEPGDLPTGLPFFPLPEEMPERQFETQRGTELTSNPEREGGEVKLRYPAAVTSLSLVESYFELVYSAADAA